MRQSLTAADVAAELGRSPQWLYDNWRRLVAAKQLPKPVVEAGGLAWNAAQVYAVLDRELTPVQRATAAAFRAALAAATAAGDDDEVEAGRRRLAARFGATP